MPGDAPPPAIASRNAYAELSVQYGISSSPPHADCQPERGEKENEPAGSQPPDPSQAATPQPASPESKPSPQPQSQPTRTSTPHPRQATRQADLSNYGFSFRNTASLARRPPSIEELSPPPPSQPRESSYRRNPRRDPKPTGGKRPHRHLEPDGSPNEPPYAWEAPPGDQLGPQLEDIDIHMASDDDNQENEHVQTNVRFAEARPPLSPTWRNMATPASPTKERPPKRQAKNPPPPDDDEENPFDQLIDEDKYKSKKGMDGLTRKFDLKGFVVPPKNGFTLPGGITEIELLRYVDNDTLARFERVTGPKLLLVVYDDSPITAADAHGSRIQHATASIRLFLNKPKLDISFTIPVLGDIRKFKHRVAQPYLISGFDGNDMQKLIAIKALVREEISFFMVPCKVPTPTYWLTLFDTPFNTPDSAAEGKIASLVREVLATEPTFFRFLSKFRDAMPATLGPEQIRKLILNSVQARALKIDRKGTPHVIFRIHMTSPTNANKQWSKACKGLRKLKWTGTRAIATARRNDFHCGLCKGIDHPTPQCPAPGEGVLPNAINTAPNAQYAQGSDSEDDVPVALEDEENPFDELTDDDNDAGPPNKPNKKANRRPPPPQHYGSPAPYPGSPHPTPSAYTPYHPAPASYHPHTGPYAYPPPPPQQTASNQQGRGRNKGGKGRGGNNAPRQEWGGRPSGYWPAPAHYYGGQGGYPDGTAGPYTDQPYYRPRNDYPY